MDPSLGSANSSGRKYNITFTKPWKLSEGQAIKKAQETSERVPAKDGLRALEKMMGGLNKIKRGLEVRDGVRGMDLYIMQENMNIKQFSNVTILTILCTKTVKFFFVLRQSSPDSGALLWQNLQRVSSLCVCCPTLGFSGGVFV